MPVRSLNLAVDTGTATGKLLLTMIGAAATFERKIMLERQRERFPRAKSEGKYRGRKLTARVRAGAVTALISKGLGPTDIAR